LLKFIAEEAINGGRVYWVCPRVEETNSNDELRMTNEEWEERKGSEMENRGIEKSAGYKETRDRKERGGSGAEWLAGSGKALQSANDELRMTNCKTSSSHQSSVAGCQLGSKTTQHSRFNNQHSSVKDRYAFLEKYLGKLGVGLVYGGMESEEKEETLWKFRNGEIRILAGTTVIEVGIDVPEASVIVIEAPESFGLSQLHQLRGRVGRGERRGVCILLTQTLDTEIAERLKIMLETDDGFEIAEADLELRGSGKISGSEQHGITEFRLANLKKDIKLIQQAREDAAELVESGIEKYPQFLEKIQERFQ